MENPIRMDDLGVPLFSETSIFTVQAIPQDMVNWSHFLKQKMEGGDSNLIKLLFPEYDIPDAHSTY